MLITPFVSRSSNRHLRSVALLENELARFTRELRLTPIIYPCTIIVSYDKKYDKDAQSEMQRCRTLFFPSEGVLYGGGAYARDFTTREPSPRQP